MYVILCLLTGDYIRKCSYDSHSSSWPSSNIKIERMSGIVLPTDTYRCKNIVTFPVKLESTHKLYWFIRQWFDETGFLGATNPNSVVPFPCANPPEMFGLPFEAFEIQNVDLKRPELTTIREIYHWGGYNETIFSTVR